MVHGMKRETAVYQAARLWWRMHRPLGFTLAQHLANPTINTVGYEQRKLARAVANTYSARNRSRR